MYINLKFFIKKSNNRPIYRTCHIEQVYCTWISGGKFCYLLFAFFLWHPLHYSFFSDRSLEIGNSTKLLLLRLFNDGSISRNEKEEFYDGARAFFQKAFKYAANNLPINDPVLLNARVLNYYERRNPLTSVDQLHFFIERY